MRIYWVSPEGHMYTGQVPDGAVCLQIGAAERDSSGRALEPEIVFIDYNVKMYQRKGAGWFPFPDLWYSVDTVQWERCWP